LRTKHVRKSVLRRLSFKRTSSIRVAFAYRLNLSPLPFPLPPVDVEMAGLHRGISSPFHDFSPFFMKFHVFSSPDSDSTHSPSDTSDKKLQKTRYGKKFLTTVSSDGHDLRANWLYACSSRSVWVSRDPSTHFPPIFLNVSAI